MTAYCISDLHLLPGPNEGFGRFGAFCERLPASTEQLFILGDLVDAWLGDDASLTAYAGVVEIIARLTASGVAVTLLAGNHDFLFGEDFRAATGLARNSLCQAAERIRVRICWYAVSSRQSPSP